MEPAPRIRLDTLTSDVIEARAVVRGLEGPLLLRGKPPAHAMDEEQAWYFRTVRASAFCSRFVVVTDPKLASHPLIEEAIALRAKLAELRDAALVRARELEEARQFTQFR